jgi:hypothetical protein
LEFAAFLRANDPAAEFAPGSQHSQALLLDLLVEIEKILDDTAAQKWLEWVLREIDPACSSVRERALAPLSRLRDRLNDIVAESPPDIYLLVHRVRLLMSFLKQ